MMKRYSIGLDYGTLSVRALLVDFTTGKELACCEYEYPHAVMDDELPCGKKLPPDWALQDPQDYLDGLTAVVRGVMERSGASAEEVAGIGIDFTSCTILPVTGDGTPLCRLPQYRCEPHAYVKLWKHHSAQPYADFIQSVAERTAQPWLPLYGGRVSSEWMFPKILQIVKEAPDVYESSAYILEALDWVCWQMTGVQSRSVCAAGYKAFYHYEWGYPDASFFRELDPRMENVAATKLGAPVLPVGANAGGLTAEMARALGLCEGTPVAVGIIDAHASVAAAGINTPGKMLVIMGTSSCHMLLSDEELGVPGMCGVVKDGILPGFFGYEAGQPCVGDSFSWFNRCCVPEDYRRQAREAGVNLHQLLRAKAERLLPGESGLIALDWFNGVRSVLMDFSLSGAIIGLTISTKPEEIYRALIEATAFGTRRIKEQFEAAGMQVAQLCAAGGIPARDPMAMQIYADVCGCEIYLAGSDQSGAFGSALIGAAAAGKEITGYENAAQLAGRIGKLREQVYRPNAENAARYDALYREYCTLHDYFGRGANDVMKRLKAMRAQAKLAREGEEKG